VRMTGWTSPRPVKRKRRKVVINLSNCRYPVLEEAAMALNWAVTRDDKAEWDLFWVSDCLHEHTHQPTRTFIYINGVYAKHVLIFMHTCTDDACIHT
jgi:hypothetical protein